MSDDSPYGFIVPPETTQGPPEFTLDPRECPEAAIDPILFNQYPVELRGWYPVESHHDFHWHKEGVAESEADDGWLSIWVGSPDEFTGYGDVWVVKCYPYPDALDSSDPNHVWTFETRKKAMNKAFELRTRF